MSLTLKQALRIGDSCCVSFIGSGGKSSAIFKLAREFPGRVIVSTTTHLGVWQTEYADRHIVASDKAALQQIEENINGVILVTGKQENDRLLPPSSEVSHRLYDFANRRSIPLLIEADGSREKPLKAWAVYEPAIPEYSDLVVLVAGLSGISKPLNAETVHRPEIYSKYGQLEFNVPITYEVFARVLTDPNGPLNRIPKSAKRVVLLNQADTPELQSNAKKISENLLRHFRSVIVTSIKQNIIHAIHEPIAGIILAAGESSRFGEPKQLLDWHGQPFIRAIAQTAIRAGLSPIIVVTGAHARQVELATSGLNVQIAHNDEWRTGQGSSIREGIKAAMDYGGVIFLLVDQPQITPSILQALIEKHTEGLQPIIAPMVLDRRANPVLFDQATFDDLLTIEGDMGGRAIFHKFKVEYLPWHDDRLLLDVDTPEQYQKLLSNEDL